MASIVPTPEPTEDTTARPYRTAEAPRIDTDAALSALNDPGCRDLLAEATDQARTARELIDACDMARSTGYRKIDLLADAGLFEEGVRLQAGGGHASEYRRAVDGITVSLTAPEPAEIDTRIGAAPASD